MSSDLDVGRPTNGTSTEEMLEHVSALPAPVDGTAGGTAAPEAAGFPAPFPAPFPVPFPWLVVRSGVYQVDPRPPVVTFPEPPVGTPFPPPPLPTNPPIPPLPPNPPDPPPWFGTAAAEVPHPLPVLGTEELRVDIDGANPTMTMSGTITRFFSSLTWLARVTLDSTTGAWVGEITYQDGATNLRPYSWVSVTLTGHPFLPAGQRASATFSSLGRRPVTVDYTWASATFRNVTLEVDTVDGALSTATFNPWSHPVHSPKAPNQALTLEGAYARAGISVTRTAGDSVIPLVDAGAGGTWSNLELHDAMEAHWSQWVDAPQWATWLLFAGISDDGWGLGGRMFDSSGTVQRQGAAVFTVGTFIADAPASDPDPAAWRERMRFWTAAHELGHTFNLLHSWQKDLGAPWVPLTASDTALSWMNYPFRFPTGSDDFFTQFTWNFDPDELLFLRHAPERMVKMGGSTFATDHGFEQDAYERLRAAVTGPLRIDLRVHRSPRFEFLEPVVAEIRLKNVSTTAVVVDRSVLDEENLTIVVAKDGGEARQRVPFMRSSTAPEPVVLQPGEALYSSILLSAGSRDWLISEPGTYHAVVVADTGAGGAALSAPLHLTVAAPTDPDAERLAGDVFTRPVAHTVAFGGSRVLHGANQTLQDVADSLPGSRAALHANAVLAGPLVRAGKVLTPAVDGPRRFDVVAPQVEAGASHLRSALADVDVAADSLGHIEVVRKTKVLADALGTEDAVDERTDALNRTADVLDRRGVLPRVVDDLRRY
ncbi:hypothetical protein Cch01nite_09240 [Cellulomonas chitinilytica]|uniref:Uncharacterized protein n=1 Tax=Cellulomonas chitinilytica TaxID=398759 RepID=A0A919P029_9CELL|nr:hypothetical protein [Cellulomonas chitinilytica]GIG20200.1 hypothetical protein Cch01nite_09240 [Cellulomonas chitinilytica]